MNVLKRETFIRTCLKISLNLIYTFCFQKIVDADGLGHCIHMGLPVVVNSPLYQRIFQLLPRARHLITNQEAPFIPFMEGIYKYVFIFLFIILQMCK